MTQAVQHNNTYGAYKRSAKYDTARFEDDLHYGGALWQEVQQEHAWSEQRRKRGRMRTPGWHMDV